MTAPLPAVRPERGSPARTPVARPGSAASGDLTPEQQAALAAQHQAFDFETAERAEIMREHEALQALLLEQLKNEDEIMKKWIAMI